MSNEIEEIKNRLDIVDVISKYMPLKQAGKNFSGLCPFHGEKTPSFIVSPDIQRYKCFGCGESGDIFNFVQKIENIDFPETLEKLAKEAGVTLEKREVNSKYKRLEEINRKAAIYFYKALLKDKLAYNYVKERGFTDESIKEFGVGYAPGGMELLNFIQKDEKYSKQELVDSGVFSLKDGKIRGKFIKRIMFPIRSSSGKVIAFTGRVIPGNDFGPKYMNSPETPIYHKKVNFYGQYESRQEIRKQDLVIICEGTTDVISAHQAGFKNIIAPLGTALTSEQLERISKLSKNILFLFDSDEAGQKALERAFPMVQELELNGYAANTLPYKDLDELIKADKEKLTELIKNKRELFVYMLTERVKLVDYSKYEEFEKLVDWAERTLRFVKKNSLKNFYVEKCLKIGKIKVRVDGTSEKFPSSTIVTKSVTKSGGVSKEDKYLQILLQRSPLTLPEEHSVDFFMDSDIKNILIEIKKGVDSKERLLEIMNENNELREIIENAIFRFSESENSAVELNKLYRNIAKDFLSNKEREINVKIAVAEESGDTKESERLLQEFQNLTIEKKKYE